MKTTKSAKIATGKLSIVSKKQITKRRKQMTMHEVTRGYEAFVKEQKKKDDKLSIKCRSLQDWINEVDNSNGIYFLDMPSLEKYSLHYKDNETGKLMALEIPEDIISSDEPDKGLLESLILDLTLFQGEESIVVWNKEAVSNDLKKLAAAYTEHAKEIEAILERLVDMEHVFAEKWYDDSRFDSHVVKSIYAVLFPKGEKISASYSMYQMFTALQCILLQVSALKMAA